MDGEIGGGGGGGVAHLHPSRAPPATRAGATGPKKNHLHKL
jgi:hypothetical protein